MHVDSVCKYKQNNLHDGHKALKCYERLACLRTRPPSVLCGSYGKVYPFLLLVGIQHSVVANLPHYLAWRSD